MMAVLGWNTTPPAGSAAPKTVSRTLSPAATPTPAANPMRDASQPDDEGFDQD